MGGVLKSISSILSPVGAVLNVVGGAISIFQALKPPKIPKFEMPTQLFNTLNQRVQALTGLSEEARANIQKALDMYKRGELLPQYKSQLDEQYERKKKEAENALAARGLLNSSIALDVAAELNRWYLRSYYDLLGQQIKDALSMSGLATTDVNAIMNEIQMHNQAIKSQIEALTLNQLLDLGRAKTLEAGIGMLGQGLQGLEGWASKTSTQTPSQQTSQLPTSQITPSIPETQSFQPTQISPSLEEYEKALRGE
jgi:hypothetical protein